MNLFEHGKDCTPLMPCQACHLVSWLRSRLTDEDNLELSKRAQAFMPAKRIRKSRSREGNAGAEGARPSVVTS